MQKLRNLVKHLKDTDCKDDIVLKLQEINKTILSKYILNSEGKKIIPLEVEAYYHRPKKFADPYVHRNELQKNRPCQLYFHRAGYSKDTQLKYGKIHGVDICLSDSDAFYLSILLRSAKIDNNIIIGPEKIAQQIATKENYKQIEKQELTLENNEEENKYSLFNCIRKGLNPNIEKREEFFKMPLRSIILLPDFFIDITVKMKKENN